MPRLTRSIAAALGALALLPATADAADATPAGQLAVYGCRLPDGSPAPVRGWTHRLWGAAAGTNTGAAWESCGARGSMAATSNSTSESPPMPRGMSAGWLFRAPTGLAIEGLRLERRTALGQMTTAPDSERYVSVVANGMPSGPWTGDDVFTDIAQYDHPVYTYPGATIYDTDIVIRGRTWTQAAFWVQCNPQSATGRCPTASFGGATTVDRATVVLLDDSAPVVTAVSGSMTQPAALAGTESLTVNATDGSGAGVYRVLMDVDGRVFPLVLDDNGGRCRDAQPGNDDPHEFVDPRPCQTTVSSTVDFDTTQLSEGRHLLKVFVEDASGRRSLGFGAQEIVVDNVPAPVSTSRPLLSGEARVGATLTTDRGAWTGPDLQYAIQWQREVGGSWEDVPGATRTSYVPTEGDTGRRLRSHVVATNGEGRAESASLATTPVAGGGAGTGEQPKDPASVKPGPAGVPGPAGAAGPGGGAGAVGPGGADGAAAGALNGTGATPGARLSAVFARTTKRTLTVRYGRAIAVTGRLLNQAGAPIVGAELDVHSLVRTVGGTFRPQGRVVSDARGEFRYLAPSGPSRTIRFAYRLRTQDADYSQTSTVEIKVIPSIAFRANKRALRNTQAVRFTGRVAGAPRTSRKLVEIQALDGRRWRTIASTRLRRGGFAFAYRFTRTRGTVTYAFRARVRTESGWPFASGQSKARRVKVRG